MRHFLFPIQDEGDGLLNINTQPSLLVEDDQIEGIHTPVVYVGMKHMAFAWDVEDYRLFSFDIHYRGEPKLWYW